METPTMMATTYGTASAYNVYDAASAWNESLLPQAARRKQEPLSAFMHQVAAEAAKKAIANQPQEETSMSERRLVRVVMVDPHEDVPTDIALLYDSKEQFTDKTDQELYFDMPVAELLKSHNEKRTKIVDKSVKERTQYLEPARIRDLKMLVVTLAKF